MDVHSGAELYGFFLHVSSYMHWIRVIPCYKESTAHLFLVCAADTPSKLPYAESRSHFFSVFPWHLCILPFFKVCLCSPPPQKSFCLTCHSIFVLFSSGTGFFLAQNLCDSGLYSFISLVVLFWICYRPVKNMSSIQLKLPFPQTPLLKKGKQATAYITCMVLAEQSGSSCLMPGPRAAHQICSSCI